ncbi:acyl-homoserine-lactone synthase [Kordiimonas marina]|uniref:acyl-homoserine-lactone synthase n=1 Tax=Kordiimonas marina TaxID=2872312 RepID=UPI001FF17692|nr:acyl-homoserine-lactone synthase [Kordiimonas marina]MCJ9427489.1 GNAT family N-acetyltransferase [Kordiimonas marina]
MIHVVSDVNRSEYRSYLRQLWQQRYEVFVEKMGWSLDCAKGIERDRFDHAETIYLLSINDKGLLKGAMRLLPTEKPHLLGEAFPNLCADKVPTAADTWEVSRFYSLTGRHLLLERDRTVSELVCGLFEYGLMHDIRHVTCVASMVLFPTILKAGWNVTPLGLPDVVDGEVVLAFQIDLDESHYQSVCATRGVEGSVLYNAPTLVPELEVAV